MPQAATRRDKTGGIPSLYSDGSYLAATAGTWHLEDAPFKARNVEKMLVRNAIVPATACEIGCGAGGVLAEIHRTYPSCSCTGYEVADQPYQMSLRFAEPGLSFVNGDAFVDGRHYDLVLVMDVVEHVEDCFQFLRNCRAKGEHKLYHIPVDAHCSAILRGYNSWDSVGHIHTFTMETVRKALEYTGHTIIDFVLTDVATGAPVKLGRTRIANLVRRPVAHWSKPLACRLFGGYSVLALCR